MDGLSAKCRILLRKSFLIKGGVKMTRKEKFFEIFPEASRYNNLPNVSPCQLDRNFPDDFCEDETCYLCRKKFWNQELNEKDSFMNF